MDTVCITITNVLNAEYGRNNALHKYVHGNSKLSEEFLRSLGGDVLSMRGADLVAALDVFIERKKFEIVRETPRVRLDDKNWYRVDVMYEIKV